MKKKLFFGLLPALLVLTSCQAAPKVDKEVKPQPIPEEQQFLEDTDAHDEIFGNSVLAGHLGTRKLPSVPEVAPDSSIPTLGVQYNDSTPGYVSIRFVAAIKIADYDGDSDVDEEDLAEVNVYWERVIFKNDGTTYKVRNDLPINSTKVYTSLAAAKDVEDDGVPDTVYTIENFNTEKSMDYTHFAVYTIRNIPTSCSDYYIQVNVTTEDPVNSQVISPLLTTSVDRKTQFVVDGFDIGYNLVKKTSTGFQTVNPAAEPGEGNLAKFENVSLNANESIAVIYCYVDFVDLGGGAMRPDFSTEIFKVFNYDDKGENGSYFFATEEGMAKVNFKATYTFQFTTGEKINVSATNIVRKLYVSLADSSVSWWEGEGVFTALFAYVYGVGGHWYTLTKVSDHLYVTDEVVDPTVYNRVIIGRIDNSIKNTDSTTWWDSGKVYNQTQGDEDAPLLPHSTTHDHAYVKRTNDWSPLYIDWWD